MNLSQRILEAFADRPKPSRLVDDRKPITPEQRDALWFDQRDWRTVSASDWESHPDAFYAFTPEAFAYYLPSILTLSADRSVDPVPATDSLLQVLNRSPIVEHWDAFISTRLLGLQQREYAVLKEWVLHLADESDSDLFGRAFDTIDLLEKETARVRAMTGTAPGRP